jgi:uncharacterized membrane protein
MPQTHHTPMLRLARILRARPHLWSSAAFGLLLHLLLSALGVLELESRALVAWNAGAVLYLMLALHLARGSSTAQMQRHAIGQSEGRALVLAVVVVAAVAVLLAVGSQLAAMKDLPRGDKTPHVLLAALTVLTSWLFTQTLFAFNYAHAYYLARAAGRGDVLAFPGTSEPTYGDFFYFACVIGTSGQTADVPFNGSELRPVGTLHCVLAFAFNTTVLALTINIAAGLF